MASLPKQHAVNTLRITDFSGGINYAQAEMQLRDNETPEAVNVWNRNGVLRSRPGIVEVSGERPVKAGFYQWAASNGADAVFCTEEAFQAFAETVPADVSIPGQPGLFMDSEERYRTWARFTEISSYLYIYIGERAGVNYMGPSRNLVEVTSSEWAGKSRLVFSLPDDEEKFPRLLGFSPRNNQNCYLDINFTGIAPVAGTYSLPGELASALPCTLRFDYTDQYGDPFKKTVQSSATLRSATMGRFNAGEIYSFTYRFSYDALQVSEDIIDSGSDSHSMARITQLQADFATPMVSVVPEAEMGLLDRPRAGEIRGLFGAGGEAAVSPMDRIVDEEACRVYGPDGEIQAYGTEWLYDWRGRRYLILRDAGNVTVTFGDDDVTISGAATQDIQAGYFVWGDRVPELAGQSATQEPFFGWTIYHIGDALYAFRADVGKVRISEAEMEIPVNPGAFFRFGDYLYYKNRGGFFRVQHSQEAETAAEWEEVFTVSDVMEGELFTPTILMNADPVTAAGDAWQPENRLNPQKRVLYNAAETASTISLTLTKNAPPEPDPGDETGGTGDGTGETGDETGDGEEPEPWVDDGKYTVDLRMTSADGLTAVTAVAVRGVALTVGKYFFNIETGILELLILAETADLNPGDTFRVGVTVQTKQAIYNLPVAGIDGVESVKVDGVTLSEAAGDYAVNTEQGYVTIATPPPVHEPPVNNTVEIVYSKANPEALNAVASCNVGAVYGGGVEMCVVLGGCPAQPNGIFWSGSTEYGLDITYWPVENYNLVGDTDDYVTGFGKQYGDLIVLKSRSTGKINASFETVNERKVISLAYERVHDKTGTDRPGTVQLVGNNIVFCDSRGGAYMLQSSSAAYENNLLPLSRKINGSERRPGLLADLRADPEAKSFDDGERYYIHANGHAWVWDYSISTWQDPCWWYWEGIPAAAGWAEQNHAVYLLTAAGALVRLDETALGDFGEACIRKYYRIPARSFGGYDRLKDVLTVILFCPPETPNRVSLTYLTDYETRRDRIPAVVYGFRREEERDARESPLGAVFRRRPMCRHVRNFALALSGGWSEEEDMAVTGVEIQFRYGGRDR